MVQLSIFPFLIPIIFSLIAFGIAGTVLWRKRQEAIKRKESMEKLAQKLGLTFTPEDAFGLVQQLQGLELFKRERSRWLNKGKIRNVMHGWLGVTEVILFDYIYTVQAGNSRRTITQTVFFANDKNWFLPNFHLKPEKWWHKVLVNLGMDTDINFEENPEFSEKFWLKGEFEGLVRQQFTPELQGFLTEKPPAHLEGSNYYLIAYKPRVKMDTDEAQLFFQHCCEIVRLLQEKGGVELLDLAERKMEGVVVGSGSSSGQ